MSYYRGSITRRQPVVYGVDLTPSTYTTDLMFDIRGKNQLGKFVVEDPIGSGVNRYIYNARRLEPLEEGTESLEVKSGRMHTNAIGVNQTNASMKTGGMREQLLKKFRNGTGSGY
jgi:hypothetical protein